MKTTRIQKLVLTCAAVLVTGLCAYAHDDGGGKWSGGGNNLAGGNWGSSGDDKNSGGKTSGGLCAVPEVSSFLPLLVLLGGIGGFHFFRRQAPWATE